MEHYSFSYSLRCYLSPEVFKDRKSELLQIPKAHQSAFLEMIVFGFSIEEATETCGKLAELSRDHGVSAISIIHSIKRMEHGVKVDCLLKELTITDLN